MPAPQPNFLIVMADQLTPGALAAYGHKVTRTPHIDALAAGGVVFESAYCNSPLCAPSRGTFLYGLLPSRTGVFDNAAEFRQQSRPSPIICGVRDTSPCSRARCIFAVRISFTASRSA